MELIPEPLSGKSVTEAGLSRNGIDFRAVERETGHGSRPSRAMELISEPLSGKSVWVVKSAAFPIGHLQHGITTLSAEPLSGKSVTEAGPVAQWN